MLEDCVKLGILPYCLFVLSGATDLSVAKYLLVGRLHGFFLAGVELLAWLELTEGRVAVSGQGQD